MGAIVLAVTFGYVMRFGLAHLGRETLAFGQLGDANYLLVGSALLVGWLVALHAAGAYEPRFLAVGSEEFKRITRATFWLFGGLAFASYLLHVEVDRRFVAWVIPLGYCLIVVGNLFVRRWLHARRARGDASYSILAIGSRHTVAHLVEQIGHAPHAGFHVVAACVEDQDGWKPAATDVPVVGRLADAADRAGDLDVDVVASTGSSSITPEFLQELGWALEGTGRRLALAPGLTNIAGPRFEVTRVAGLPLVWVDEPEFTGFGRTAKRAFDVVGALLLLIILAPVLLVTGLAIRATSPGPIFFRQFRTGLHGESFRVWKFRSMFADAEKRRDALGSMNESDGYLFKIKNDPRVTPVGRFMRRWSIDELPQLLNVLAGEMSLVGPRPLPAVESNYEGPARRRLLVQPGITGLWQVSGRSDTSWDEAVRLDLYYVENWSFALDLVILVRTGLVVWRGVGAY